MWDVFAALTVEDMLLETQTVKQLQQQLDVSRATCRFTQNININIIRVHVKTRVSMILFTKLQLDF